MFMKRKQFNFIPLLVFVLCSGWLYSCQSIDLYEKTVPIPDHRWSSRFKPEFTFTIQDTAVPYQVYVILRHDDLYNYNNIWVNLYTKAPGDTVQKIPCELPLASKEKGWLGSAMDDIYEQRVAITPANQKLYFRKKGEYHFTIEQIMREDPLLHVMDVGLRLEKKPQ